MRMFFQEEDLARLWQTLQERGFCGGAGLSPAGSEATGGVPSTAQKAAISAESVHAQLCGGGRRRTASAAEIEDILGGGAAGIAGAAAVDGKDAQEEPGSASRTTVDIVLHSVAHAPTDAMSQGFIMVSDRESSCRDDS